VVARRFAGRQKQCCTKGTIQLKTTEGRGLGIAAAHEKNLLSNSMHETTTADEERPQQLGPPPLLQMLLLRHH
jgi:hypothetical protein